MPSSPLFWVLFSSVIAIVMILDLGVFNRHTHKITYKEAGIWTIVWISLALLFNLFIFWQQGLEPALLFTTGYLVELSLSVDNLFVFTVLFSYFNVPAQYRHKILFWGIMGAIVLRILFILAGVGLIHRFHWIIYVFGAFLIYTGFKLGFSQADDEDPDKNFIIRWSTKLIPMKATFEGGHFVTCENGKLVATSLLIVLLAIEGTDVVFALDSIPAILAITTDPFLVITSNIFAIIGLRSMFFLLAGLMDEFHYLKKGLAVILTFIGVKMLIADFFKIPTLWALVVIAVVLASSILASKIWPRHPGSAKPSLGKE